MNYNLRESEDFYAAQPTTLPPTPPNMPLHTTNLASSARTMNSGRSSPTVVVKSPQSLSPSLSAYLARQTQQLHQQQQQQEVPNDAKGNDANVPTATDEVVEFELSLRAQLCSEVVGTYLLVLIGLGGVVVSHYTNSGGTTNANSNNATDSALWSLGAMLAIYSAASISGGHLNPAVTLAFALVRPAAFPARKILSYCLAQVLGACLGAVTIVVLFQQIMTNYEHEIMSMIPSKCKLSSSSLFVYGTSRDIRGCQEYDQVHLHCLAPFLGSWGSSDTPPSVANEFHAFFIEAFGTAVILFVVFSVTSPFYPIPGPAVPPVVAVVIGVMMYMLGPLTGQHLNPAIEIGRRLGGMAWLFYQSVQNDNNGIPIVIPHSSELFRMLEMVGRGLRPFIIGPMIGGPIGAWLAETMQHIT